MEKKVKGQEFVSKHCLNGKSLGVHLPLISSDNNKAKAEESDDDMIDEILGTIEEENGFIRCNVSAEKQQSQSSLIQEKMEELMMISVGNGNRNGSDDQDLQDSYDLRENPKKSWKISDVRTMAAVLASEAAYPCKDCQKSFPSSRALAGHMRAHAVKGKKNLHSCKKCSKGFESVRALYGHMKTHSNKRPRLSASATTTTATKSEFDVDYPRKKRSVIRYNLTPNPSSPSPSTSPNANSAEFDIVDEVEDAAQCLMMLSRDFGSVDDNSVEFDSNSFQSQSQSYSQSRSMKFSVTRADEEENPLPEKKMDSSSFLVTEISKFENHNNVAAKDAEIKQEPKISRSASSDSADSTRVEAPPGKELRLGTLGLGTDQDDSELLLQSDPIEKKSSVEDGIGNGNPPVWKKRGYKCRTCNMIFSSHQALGGHRNRHKTIISSSSSGSGLTNNDEYFNCNVNGGQNQKSKDHECAVCFKVFPTGQALGGHKRAHYAGFTESKTSKEITVGISKTSDHDLQQQILEANSSKLSQQDVSTESAEVGDITHCGGGVNMLVIQGSSHCCSLSLCN